jgi:hypothetical protein
MQLKSILAAAALSAAVSANFVIVTTPSVNFDFFGDVCSPSPLINTMHTC